MIGDLFYLFSFDRIIYVYIICIITLGIIIIYMYIHTSKSSNGIVTCAVCLFLLSNGILDDHLVNKNLLASLDLFSIFLL